MTKEDDKITISRAELKAMIDEGVKAAAESAAEATVKVQRGVLGLEGQMATQEERVSRELGRPPPPRRVFPKYTLSCHRQDLGADFDVSVSIRTHDEYDVPLEKPVHSCIDAQITKYPDDLERRSNMPPEAIAGYPGQGKQLALVNGEIKWYSYAFLKWVTETYDHAIRREHASKKDPIYCAAFVKGEPKHHPSGETRREATGLHR